MEKQKSQGITIIALVVTIIILLILAGITIAMLTGKNGIISKAQEAKYENEKSEALEKEKLADYEKLISYYSNDLVDISSMTTKEFVELVDKIVEAKLESGSTSDTTPAGTVISYMGKETPEGYLKCDGSTYNISIILSYLNK